MSLRVDLDIADAYVAEKAFALADNIIRSRDPGDFGNTGLWFLPGGKGTTILPVQLLPSWRAATGKWAAADWLLDATRYELLQKRGAGDWFVKSRGLASANVTAAGVTKPDGVTAIPIISKAALGENQGVFVEMHCYGVPGTITMDVLQIRFAGGLILHVHSSGTADLEDQRPASVSAGTNGYLSKGQPLTAAAQGAAGQLGAGKTDLTGKELGIILLPYRRGRLLVNTTQGGYFEVDIGGRTDASDGYSSRRSPTDTAYYITTDAGQVTLTPSPALPACLTANPLTYPLSGLLTSPITPLPYKVATTPDTISGEAEQQDGASVTLTITDRDGNTFAPSPTARLGELIYSVAFAGATAIYAPVLYSLEIHWDRVLGTRTYGTAVIPTATTRGQGVVTGARLSLSRDRQQKSCEFTIDNPGDAYTSVKDLWNRRVRLSFDPGGADSVLGIPAGQVLVIFDGYTDPAEFADGTASKIRIPCTGRRKRLRSHLLADSQKFDGMSHTAVVVKLLTDAGVDPSDIVVFADTTPLDSANPGEDALWRPANGTSTDEFIQHIADTFSGWVFDDVAGTFYYAPKEYFTAAALASVPTAPTVYLTTPVTGFAARTRPANTTTLVALADSVKQTSEEPRANDFWVLGQDDDGSIVAAHYEDWDSINTRTAANFVGERRTLVYASGSITTAEAAQAALGPLIVAFGQAIRTVPFSLPDYQIQALPLEGPLILTGYGPALITALDADLGSDRSRRTDYCAQLL